MSEEIKLTPSDFEELKELLDFMRETEKDKVKVMILTLNFRDVLYKLGYSDEDIISIQEIERYLNENLDEDTSINQLIKLHQEVNETLERTSSIHQTSSTADEDSDEKIISEISPRLEAIGKVVPISGSNKTEKKLAIYLLLKNKEMFDPDLRKELAPLGTLFSRRKEPYSSGTINNVISFVRNSPHIWSSKDPTTGMFVYRLKEETAKKIIDTFQITLKEREILREQEELRKADRDRMKEAVMEFYDKVYRQRIIDLATVSAAGFLLVDWVDLRSYNPELAEFVRRQPREAMEIFEQALKEFRKNELLLEEGDYAVHFTNVGEILRVKDLKDVNFGEMVTVRAMVSGVTSKKKLFYSKMVFVCQSCGYKVVLEQDPVAKVEFITKCPACGSLNSMKIDASESEVEDIIFFSLQDMVEDLGGKEQPSKVSAYMLRPHVSLSPGNRVLVTGIVRDTVYKERKQLSDVVLEVHHVEFLDDLAVGDLSEEDIAEIKALKGRYGDDLPNAVARSLAPQIFADPELLPELWFFKKAIVYAIASPKELGPGDEREWIHVLAVGDKGTGKSRIIRDIKNITVAVYGEGANVSGAGLIGMPEREELTGEWVFRGGLMVRANGFVLALDEFEKANPEDYARMHGGMSYGTVDFSKASISTTLKTMESIIAVANPIGGYFNSFKNVFEQITLPSSLLDRFDVIFILRQPTSEKVIEAIYDHQDRFEAGEIVREIPEDTLRKLFLYVRDLRPTFTKKAREELKRFGMIINKALLNAGFKYSMRLRGILKRLSRANAQLRLSEKVELKDVLAAEEVFTASIKSWGDNDVDWSVLGEIEAHASKEDLELIGKVVSAFEELHEYYQKIPLNEAIEALKVKGVGEEKAKYALELAKEQHIVESEKGRFWLVSRV